jgi:hypothetical protein
MQDFYFAVSFHYLAYLLLQCCNSDKRVVSVLKQNYIPPRKKLQIQLHLPLLLVAK